MLAEFNDELVLSEPEFSVGAVHIQHSYIMLDEFTQVSSEPELSGETGQPINIRVEPTQTEKDLTTGLLTSEVDISARLISALPAEVDISARLIWSLPAAMPAAKVDVTTTTCKRMLTNHTMEFMASTGFYLGA